MSQSKRGHRTSEIERKYDCPRCMGTGEIESSDSTEDGWWDCRACEGTGKLEDRRRPDPQLAGAVEALRHILESAEHPSLTVRSTEYIARVARDALDRLADASRAQEPTP